MSLASNIRMLTQKHPTIHNGKITTAQPLLTQLTSTNTAKHKNNSGSETPLPISIKAIALWQDLTHEAKNTQWSMTGDDTGDIWTITHTWEHLDDPQWTPHLENITNDWIQRIQHTIDPPRSRRPLRQPCASCGQRWTHDTDGQRTEAITAWVWDDNGEHVTTYENWDVHCTNCGAQWHGKEVIKNYWRAIEQPG